MVMVRFRRLARMKIVQDKVRGNPGKLIPGSYQVKYGRPPMREHDGKARRMPKHLQQANGKWVRDEDAWAMLREMGRRLHELRIEADVSVHELARATGISYNYIYRIEKGQHSPTMLVLVKLALALGAQPSELVP